MRVDVSNSVSARLTFPASNVSFLANSKHLAMSNVDMIAKVKSLTDTVGWFVARSIYLIALISTINVMLLRNSVRKEGILRIFVLVYLTCKCL